MAESGLSFTIVVPTYRRRAALARCLRSIAELDFPRDRFEVVVVDDGSEDAPEAEVAELSSVVAARLLRQPNAGPGAARNTGAAAARGRFLAFTDDDCRPDRGWLRALEAALEVDPDRLVGGRTVNALAENLYSEASQAVNDYLYAEYERRPGTQRFCVSYNMAVHAETFRQLGGFDVTFRPASEDRELSERWLASGRPIAYAPDAVVGHEHELDLRSFWAQQKSYGHGAWQLRNGRARPTSSRFEAIAFYLGLVASPFRRRGVTRRIRLSALLLLSQLAIAVGYTGGSVRHALARGPLARGRSRGGPTRGGPTRGGPSRGVRS